MIQLKIRNTIPEALSRFQGRLASVLIDAVSEIRDTAASRAVVLYMRDAQRERSESGGFLPRNPNDSGPLRILSGRLAQSILGGMSTGQTSPDSIYELTVSRNRVRLLWGSRTPYANIQERGGTAGFGAVIPARPFLTPALESLEPEAAGIVDPYLQRLANEVGL